MSITKLLTAIKGGSGSGNFGHSGRPGAVGGSAASSFTSADIDNALDIIGALVRSGGKMSGTLTDGARAFLQETVEDRDYTLQRGMHLMRFRVDDANKPTLNALQVGDNAPDFLLKQGTDYTSFTSKPSVAKYYAKEGHLGLIVEANVPKTQVIVDLKNLQKVLKKHGIEQEEFGDEDFKYFKRDAEVIVDGLPAAKVIDKYGRL